MVNTGTNWCEFAKIETASSIATTKAFATQWLCCYPHPKECWHDNNNEFMGVKFQELLTSYDIQSKPMTLKNPTANAIGECMFCTLGE